MGGGPCQVQPHSQPPPERPARPRLRQRVQVLVQWGGGTQWRQIRDFYKVASKTMDRDYQINPDKPSVVRAEEAYEEYFTWRGRR